MNTSVKRLLPLLLLLTLPAVVQAQFNFTTNNGAITITGYTGPGGDVTIPGSTNGYPVTSIGEWAFYAASVTNVLIPDSVTNIADGAFFDCASLTSVAIGDSVATIGDWTFAFCSSLTSTCFRGNAPSLGGANVFYGNVATVYYLPVTTNWGPTFDGHPAVLWNPPVAYNYTTNNDAIIITGWTTAPLDGVMTIPGTINFLPVTSIGEGAFWFCTSLTNATIPNSVTSIGQQAFSGCTSLIAITVDTGNCAYSDVDGVLFDKSQTTLIGYPGGIAGGYTIPNSVASIGDYAFEFCNSLTSLTIPNSVTSIGWGAFALCSSLTSLTIPNSVTSIEAVAFDHCQSLTNLTIGTSVTSIGAYTFWACSNLTSVTIPGSVTSIGNRSFQLCSSVTNLTIGNSVTNIGASAFSFCTSLTGVYFQGNAPTADSSVFAGDTNATAYYLPGTTGWGAFFTNTGIPAVLWNPQAQNLGVQTNQLFFTITGASNLVIVVEACTNPANSLWSPLGTNTLNNFIGTNGTSYFSDPQWTNYPGRFYRLRSP